MVLNARDKLFALFAIVIAASALLVAHGCVSRDPQRARQSGFAHAPHVESGMACDSCHRSSEGDSAGMPTWAVCHVCHGKSERREPLAFEIAIQGYDPQVPFRRESGTVFDLHAAHEAHERAGIACSTCHGDASEPMPRYDAKRCGDCHGERGVKRDCETCHRELRPDVAPPSHHGAGWIETHGEEARFRNGSGSGHGDVCALCHAESDCLDCHRVTPPANHTMFFRQRGHGLVASIEREECTACHQESFCVTCHREERPRSHHRA
ncbi:MAG TPA: hypothetical protein VK116_10890, partial [Planctomycetota bacterium]|nr:hypothetical protein [Planctomycetota bacterium]